MLEDVFGVVKKILLILLLVFSTYNIQLLICYFINKYQENAKLLLPCDIKEKTIVSLIKNNLILLIIIKITHF